MRLPHPVTSQTSAYIVSKGRLRLFLFCNELFKETKQTTPKDFDFKKTNGNNKKGEALPLNCEGEAFPYRTIDSAWINTSKQTLQN